MTYVLQSDKERDREQRRQLRAQLASQLGSGSGLSVSTHTSQHSQLSLASPSHASAAAAAAVAVAAASTDALPASGTAFTKNASSDLSDAPGLLQPLMGVCFCSRLHRSVYALGEQNSAPDGTQTAGDRRRCRLHCSRCGQV